jgi:hypothetical protein
MPLATKNNAIIVKDGSIAENCECCDGWYCDLVATPCCSPNALTLQINFVASPALASVRFGEEPVAGLRNSFPVTISRVVTLNKTSGQYTFTSGFNDFGLGERVFEVAAEISLAPSATCECQVQITSMWIGWAWDKDANGFSPGDSAREPAGFQYAYLVFQTSGQPNPALRMSRFFKFGQVECFPPTSFSVDGQAIPGFGSATGTVTLSPA